VSPCVVGRIQRQSAIERSAWSRRASLPCELSPWSSRYTC